MDVAVVYESIFGNSRLVAEAIADGVKQAEPAATVSVVPVAQATAGRAKDADLLIVGGPTHMLRMSTERSRQQGAHAAAKQPDGGSGGHLEPGAAGPGIREWLATLPQSRPGARAAAFDTRLRNPLAGSAARSIARQLRHHGYQLAAKPAGFTVDDAEGPLHAGERDRAKAWGAAVCSHVPAS